MNASALRRWFYDARVRAWISQAAVAGALFATIWYFVANASENMVKAGIASGFDFLWRNSGIDVPFRIVDYSPQANILSLLWRGRAASTNSPDRLIGQHHPVHLLG